MCGILAHVAFKEDKRIPEATVSALARLLVHRGPDSGGVFLRDNVALAVRRLSIIDLAGGEQPVFSADNRYTIVFNGEIYNHNELREELRQKGYPFKTRSDTEALLYAYIDQKEACLSKLNGMFAFAVWDNKERELFLARDRMGIKPLYYSCNAERAMFCSELTPFYRSKLFSLTYNLQAVSDYLAYWYICEPKTIFKEVFQLPPGSFAVVRNNDCRQQRYWEIPCGTESTLSAAEAADQLEALLRDAVRIRMKVDVPIGTFLSGGIDSGLVTALAREQVPEHLQAFSIGFKEKSYSELALAAQTARRYQVELIDTTLEEITPDMVDQVFDAFDEPLGNASFVPTYFLAKRAREHVKVVLTGDGGDELFGGYPTYQAPYYQAVYRYMPRIVSNGIAGIVAALPVSHSRISLDYRLKQLMKGLDLPYQRAHICWREVAPLRLQKDLFRADLWKELSSYDPFSVAEMHFLRTRSLSRQNQLMYVDMNTYLLNDHLRKVDRMAMAHSLEARVPFLDHRIVEWAMRLPSHLKVNFFSTKIILKKIAGKYLPRAVIRGKKKGLTSPIAGWLCSQLRDYTGDRLQGGLIEELFSPPVVRKILDEHLGKEHDHSRILWGLLALQQWGRKMKKGC